ncbi:RBBP9/YdeN family alpha/beta hydrolase [Acinetobacter sp.]|jgi:predicted alpha/beta hydrolase family esterase|uniref:RBBP9/YdeN family alpha/beta hydrolase n=1 Tax=Acinetobacter sp. TaxID=472 RepID=UPI0035B08979
MNTVIQKKVYIVHGCQASPNDHWFPWLSRKVQAAGHSSRRVMLPESHQPDFEVWQRSLALQIPHLDENTIIVAHSLGCVAALHYLNQQFQTAAQTIQAGIFISGFAAPLAAIPELKDFIVQAKLDSARLQTSMPLAFCVLSSNDPIVPPPFTLQLSNLLNAQCFEVKNAGHFMRTDGYAEFHEMWELIKPLLAN